MVAGDQRLVHTPLVPSGYRSPCAPLVWNQGFPTPLGGLSMSTNPVKEPNVRFSSSQFYKTRHEKAVSRTSLAEVIYAWPCESILRGRADSSHSQSYQGIWGPRYKCDEVMLVRNSPQCSILHQSIKLGKGYRKCRTKSVERDNKEKSLYGIRAL
uniref:Uncharacterized protein n=1 Tax=Schistosoma curassoni TaxID=6186 RepID=A0A183JY02_9TREM